MLQLAEHLHKSIAEVEAMSVAHFNEWVAYFELKHEREQAERAARGLRRGA